MFKEIEDKKIHLTKIMEEKDFVLYIELRNILPFYFFAE